MSPSHKLSGLVLIHGAGGTPELNFPFMEDLAAHAAVVAPRLPGGVLDADTLADDVVSAADDAGLATFAVAGYSLGSALAVRLTARHPDRVTGLVLAAGFAHVAPATRSLAAVWRALLDGPPEPLAAFLAWACSNSDHLLEADPDAHAAAVRALAVAGVPEGTAGQVDLVGVIDVRDDLAAIAVPTSVVVPTGDLLIDPSHGHALAAGIAGARTVAVDSGHLVGVDAPAPWRAEIDALLRRVSA
jgi:pimeloyl-ACP methyl ester carboxylesterase